MAEASNSKTISTRQEWIAKLARQMPTAAMTSLSKHMDEAWLAEAFRRTRKDGAVGVDGQTAEMFAADLEQNLGRLIDQAKSGTYRAPAVRRVHIPKGDGTKTRPIGIPTFEDKVLQRAVVMLLEPVFEEDFYDFSYGFRPGKSAHDALEVLDKGLFKMRGGWVLDVDIQSFFDTLDHEKLRDLLRQRVVDGVVVRLVGKWLRAGVLDGGVVHRAETGTPQGGVISPLLANIYLHTALDAWWVRDVLPRLRGKAFLVRYADDFVIAFSNREDALRVQKVLPQRLERYGLTLHPEKTRLIRFESPADDGPGSESESFDFLGLTYYWGRTRRGTWTVKRKTAKGRFSRSLSRIKHWMRKSRHLPLHTQAKTLANKLRGHFNYYGVVGNWMALKRFHYEVKSLWKKWLSRRSQRGDLTWSVMDRIFARYRLPPPRLPPRVRWRPANL